MTLYHGELLEGIYEDWGLRHAALSHAASQLPDPPDGVPRQRGNFEQSIAYGQEILRRDPVREEIHRSLMRLYLENGQRTLAIRQYARCCELLEQELGVPPLEETQALYQQIMAASRVGAPTTPMQPASADITQLLRELQAVKQNIDEATRTLAGACELPSSQSPNIPLNGPSGNGAVMQK